MASSWREGNSTSPRRVVTRSMSPGLRPNFSIEASASDAVSRGTLEKLGLKPGVMLRVTSRRGEVELPSRQDDAIPDGVIFIPFAYVEAAANILTNTALDPFGKIPEFKFCAGKVEAAKPRMEAAE